jgi:hypothetical protein
MDMKQFWISALAASLFALPFVARADDSAAIALTLRNHRFEPAEIKVPAGKAIAITLKNEDDAPEEFDSTALRVEKVVAGRGTVTIKLKPLAAGRYPFKGEYHEATAQGVLIAE